MRGWFRRLPIRRKLVAMIMATTAVVLLLASLGYLWLDYRRAQNDMVADLSALATVIVENSASLMLYDDKEDAAKTLNSLSAQNHVRMACLYKADGGLFVSYESGALTPCPAARTDDQYEFRNNRLQLWINPIIQGDHIGTLYIRSDLVRLRNRLRDQSLMVALLLVLALGAALALSARLQAVVSEPVSDLARTAARVSAEGDYSLRATRTTDDELGVLVDGFNRMLERIQLREVELSKANEELRREIEERLRVEQERSELLVREREANRLKDEFLATLSHELRTPLNAILGWAHLLTSGKADAAMAERAIGVIRNNALAQSQLIEDILDVSRIIGGKLRLSLRSVHLRDVIEAALDSASPAADAKSIRIERQYDDVEAIQGDADRLQQIVWNLLSNAVKFTPRDGVVTVRLQRQGDDVVLSVQDTGIGISPDFLPSVFDRFTQADGSATRRHGGLGLGMAIVRHLVELHGGTVTVESEGENRGSTFVAHFPIRVPALLRAEASSLEVERVSPDAPVNG